VVRTPFRAIVLRRKPLGPSVLRKPSTKLIESESISLSCDKAIAIAVLHSCIAARFANVISWLSIMPNWA
jgi:hypothetical protein